MNPSHQSPASDPQAQTDSILVACPSCHAVVRTPEARLAERPRCPRCKSLLLSGRPIVLDSATFETHINRGQLPILVDFWAPWCGPCRMMAPVLERLAGERPRLQVAKVNSDEQQELAARFQIRSIPTLILFRNQQELARQSGAVDLGSLTRWLDAALSG